MNIRSRLLPLLLSFLMIMPGLLITAPVIVSAATEQGTLYASDAFWTRLDSKTINRKGPTFQIDATGGTRRMAYVFFDFSEYIDRLDEIVDIKMRFTPQEAVTSSSRLIVYMLTQELSQYNSDAGSLVNYDAVETAGLTAFESVENLLYISPAGMQVNVSTISVNISSQIKAYFENYPYANPVIGFKVDAMAGSSGFVMHSVAATTDSYKPALLLTSDLDLREIVNARDKIRANLPMFASDDITMPSGLSEIPGLSISWRSLNPDIITDDGVILNKPVDVVTTKFEADISYEGRNLKYIFDVGILREGSYAGKALSTGGSEAEIAFDLPAAPSWAAGHILKIPSVYLTSGVCYTVYKSGSTKTEIAKFFPDTVSEYSMIDVSGFVTEGAVNFTVEADRGVIKDNRAEFVLDSINSDIKSMVYSVNTLDLGDMSEVTADLTFPSETADGVSVTWQSSNQTYLGNNGRVDRPYSSEADVNIELAAVSTVDSYTYKKIFMATIVKQSGESSGFPVLYDPMHMKDTDFFGVWNEAQARWSTHPKLRYDLFPDLAAVSAQAKTGNYQRAKEELLIYYRNRTSVPAYKLSNNFNYLYTEMMTEKIYGWMQVDDVVGMTTVKSDWQFYTVDLNLSSLPSALFMVESEMDGSSIEIYSKEHSGGKYGAYLEAMVDGVKRTFPVAADTYISAGDNADTTYGDEEILYSREAAGSSGTPARANPFATETRRPYFRFNLGQVSGSISSVKLNFYARTDNNKTKKVFIFTSRNQYNFNENTLTWAGQYPMIFNFKQTGYVWDPTISSRWHLENEWENYGTRLYPINWLVPRYRTSGNELYAYRALEFMMALYSQQPDPFLPRDLEAGWRTEFMCILFFGTLYSNSITPEVLTAQLKYAYEHANKLPEVSANGAFNQVSAKLSGALRTMAYFPEIQIDGKWEKSKKKMADELYDIQLNPDGSYMESTTGYVGGVIDELRLSIDLISLVDGKGDVYYDRLSSHYKKLLKYVFDFSMPYGLTIPWGDGGRSNYQNFAYNHWLTHPELDTDGLYEYVYTQGAKGNEPNYTSILYSDKAIAFLKSGWKKTDFGAIINANFGGAHSHPDDLSLNVSAYGSALLVEAGAGSYTSGDPMSGISTKTYSHNTIEIDKKNQEGITSSTEPQKLLLNTNKIFDFVEAGSKKIYPGFDVNRKVLFLHNKYWIVSDYITPADNLPHTYKQAWRPDQRNYLTLDEDSGTMSTHFVKGPNIQTVPADPEKLSARAEKSYTVGPYGTELTDYVRYCLEDVTGPQTFDTVLYPDRQGEKKYVTVKRLDLGPVKPITATALKIDIELDTGYYYSSNETVPQVRTFGSYTTDGQMAYVEVDSKDKTKLISLTQAKSLKKGALDLVTSADKLADLGIEWSADTLKLSTEKGDIKTSALNIYSDSAVRNVTLNGIAIDFTYSDNIVRINYTDKPVPPPPSGPSGGLGSLTGNNNAGNPLKGSGGVIAPVLPDDNDTKDEEKIFNDISEHWAENEILKMYEDGIVTGGGEGSFRPDDNITRAEFTAIIVRALKIPAYDEYEGIFSDITSDDWFYAVVESAYRAGIINGYDNGSFCPGNLITRQEMAKILVSACEYLNIKYNTADIDSVYSDFNSIADWAKESVAALTDLQLMRGMEDGSFSPHSNAVRAQAAVVAYRLLSLTEESE